MNRFSVKSVTALFPLLQMKNVPYRLPSVSQTSAGHHPTRACWRNKATCSPWLTAPTVMTARPLLPSTRAVYWIATWMTPCGTWWWRRPMALCQPAREEATPSRSVQTNVMEMSSRRHRPMKQRPTLSTTWVRPVSFLTQMQYLYVLIQEFRKMWCNISFMHQSAIKNSTVV